MSVPVFSTAEQAELMCAVPGSCRVSGVQFPGSTSHLALSDGQCKHLRGHLKADLCSWCN